MKDTWKGLLKDLFTLALLIVVVVIPIRLFVISPFIVDGESMHPTFENLDYLIVDEMVYDFSAPARGDVIVFRYPNDPSLFYIKRIIGLPGETVSINQGVVTITTVDGKNITLAEPYIVNEDATYTKRSHSRRRRIFRDGRQSSEQLRQSRLGIIAEKRYRRSRRFAIIADQKNWFLPRRGKLHHLYLIIDTTHNTMMRDCIPGEELLHKAYAIGQYYGFTPLSLLTTAARGVHAKAKTETALLDSESDPVAETVMHFLKQCQNIACAPSSRQPLFIWHTNIAPGRPVQKKVTLQFHALGTDRAIADTVVIRALLALSRDLFHEEPTVRINSMGDKETRARYARELGVFFKKRASVLPEECLAYAKDDIFRAAEYALENGYTDDFPAPTEHLSDASRKRFEDLLEYLEMTETPYELARHLISRGGDLERYLF